MTELMRITGLPKSAKEQNPMKNGMKSAKLFGNGNIVLQWTELQGIKYKLQAYRSI